MRDPAAKTITNHALVAEQRARARAGKAEAMSDPPGVYRISNRARALLSACTSDAVLVLSRFRCEGGEALELGAIVYVLQRLRFDREQNIMPPSEDEWRRARAVVAELVLLGLIMSPDVRANETAKGERLWWTRTTLGEAVSRGVDPKAWEPDR